MKRLITIFVALVAALVVSADCHAQFSRLSFGKYGIESLWPESFSSLKGAVWVDVTNPTEGFTVSQIKGTLYKDGKPFVTGTADSFRVLKGTNKCTVSGRASLCEGVSFLNALTLLSFDPEDYTADVTMRVTMDSGTSRVVTKKGVKIAKYLK